MSEDIEQLNVEDVLKTTMTSIDAKEDSTQTNDVISVSSNGNHQEKEEIKSSSESLNKQHFDTYLNSFMHSIYCRVANCTYTNCKQFKQILHHSKNCQKLKVNQCDLCRQLITLCIYHAKSCSDDSCRLPLCNSIKRKLKEHEELKLALQFITNSLDVLKSKLDKEIQVSDVLITNKRKHDLIDNDHDMEMLDLDKNCGDSNQNELGLKKQLLLERFKQIEENPSSEPTGDKLTKSTRLELIKTFYNQCYNDFLKIESDNKCNANFVALLLRQEQYINKMTQSVEDYLHLLTYYFYQVIKRLEMRKQFRSVGVQADLTDNESNQNDYQDANKRFKLAQKLN